MYKYVPAQTSKEWWVCLFLCILWVGSVVCALIYTTLTWKRPSCTFNYFNNPFIRHKCKDCRSGPNYRRVYAKEDIDGSVWENKKSVFRSYLLSWNDGNCR